MILSEKHYPGGHSWHEKRIKMNAKKLDLTALNCTLNHIWDESIKGKFDERVAAEAAKAAITISGADGGLRGQSERMAFIRGARFQFSKDIKWLFKFQKFMNHPRLGLAKKLSKKLRRRKKV